jgi:hypothetical protein
MQTDQEAKRIFWIRKLQHNLKKTVGYPVNTIFYGYIEKQDKINLILSPY